MKTKMLPLRISVAFLLLSIALFVFSGEAVFADNFISDESRLLLKKLVETNSGTENISGQDKMRALLIPEFKKLGFAETLHVTPNGRKVLSLKFPDSKPFILYMGHIDTVFPESTEFKKFHEKEDKIIGPGIIDMKGGIVMMLDTLKSVNADIRKNVLIILNDDEEVGSFESNGTYIPLVKGIRYALVFEPGLKDGSFVSSSAGLKWLDLEVKGRAAHAGLEPDLGVNACLELAKKIPALSELTDYSKKITVNVGVISGGTKPNVVCENALARIDIRYVDRKDLDDAVSNMQEITNNNSVFSKRNNEPATATLKTVVEVPSLPPESTRELVKITRQVAEKIGVDFRHQHVGYGSDGNYLSALPHPVNILVGLGPYGDGMHCKTEYLSKRSYAERLKLNISLLKKLTE
ncbi:MAG: M20 family metallopeptidase [Desulfobacteraceae bacterium]|nr:M20 family metallopeptidase [Desulfobacteraceae bacterium]